VLFAPGLPDLAAVRAVCAAVSKPVNFMVGIKEKSFPLSDLPLSRSNDRFSGRCKRSKRQGRVQFPRRVRDNAGAEQTHADLNPATIIEHLGKKVCWILKIVAATSTSRSFKQAGEIEE
jgi:hypothetical protein